MNFNIVIGLFLMVLGLANIFIGFDSKIRDERIKGLKEQERFLSKLINIIKETDK